MWQPIATAPKDGTLILAWGPQRKEDRPFTSYAVLRWCSCFQHWVLCDGEDEEWTGSTHWRPLEAPPEQQTPESLEYVPIIGKGVDAIEARTPEAIESAKAVAAKL